jgi:GNAT superfamily N-acetyltransferase
MTGQAGQRALLPGDLDRVVEIDGATTGRSRRGFYAKRFAAVADDPASVVALAAERDGRVVGFAFAQILDGEFGGAAPAGVLDAIGVATEARAAGVATSLLARLEAELFERGVRELRTQADWTEHGLASFFSSSGFRLSSRLVLERDIEKPFDDEFDWAELPVRSMAEGDLPAIVRIDQKITGRDRTRYYRRKASEALRQSGVRVSLVAEVDRQFAGFLMARVDLGEYGRTDPVAVLDTIGVAPAFAGRRVGRALLEQLLLNLRSLRVERILTEVEWDHFGLLKFLARTGFGRSQRLSFVKAIG